MGDRALWFTRKVVELNPKSPPWCAADSDAASTPPGGGGGQFPSELAPADRRLFHSGIFFWCSRFFGRAIQGAHPAFVRTKEKRSSLRVLIVPRRVGRRLWWRFDQEI